MPGAQPLVQEPLLLVTRVHTEKNSSSTVRIDWIWGTVCVVKTVVTMEQIFNRTDLRYRPSRSMGSGVPTMCAVKTFDDSGGLSTVQIPVEQYGIGVAHKLRYRRRLYQSVLSEDKAEKGSGNEPERTTYRHCIYWVLVLYSCAHDRWPVLFI